MTAVLGVTPILNVSDIRVSIEWFEQMGRRELWVWDDEDAGPDAEPGSAAVGSGDAQISLCRGAQGSRGERRPQFAPPRRPHLPGQLRPELSSHGMS
jgi:hypothetical protein